MCILIKIQKILVLGTHFDHVFPTWFLLLKEKLLYKLDQIQILSLFRQEDFGSYLLSTLAFHLYFFNLLLVSIFLFLLLSKLHESFFLSFPLSFKTLYIQILFHTWKLLSHILFLVSVCIQYKCFHFIFQNRTVSIRISWKMQKLDYITIPALLCFSKKILWCSSCSLFCLPAFCSNCSCISRSHVCCWWI